MQVTSPETRVAVDPGPGYEPKWWKPKLLRPLRDPLLVVLGIITVFWKLALTKQYTFLASVDLANMVVPRLQATIYAIRHGTILLWTPYEFFGQPPLGQVEPAILSPLTFLLALAPLHQGYIQFFYIHLWFVLIHCLAGLFAWRFFRELDCSGGPAVIGGILFATIGFYGNTVWPNHLNPAILAPLVFLFLLRSLRGRAPLKNAAWAGVMLGISWLCGHHDPALIMTLAIAGIGLYAIARPGNRRQASLRMLVLFTAMGLVAAVQILPAMEYGRLSTRWTETGPKTWKDRVPFTEHEQYSLKPSDLVHVPILGGNNSFADPFVGTVGLSLTVIGVWSGFRRKEVRLMVSVAIAALLYAMAASDALYGPLYALAPLVEKTREPIVAVFLFQFAVVSLAVIGAGILFSAPEPSREGRIVRTLLWFGGIILGVVFVQSSLKSPGTIGLIAGDSRPVMTAVIALMLAAALQAWSRNVLRREWALAAMGLLVVIEQGNEVNWNWALVTDAKRMVLLNNIVDTQDLGDWLRKQPDPKRIQKDDKDVPFDFGAWHRLDSGNSYGASMLTQTADLAGWWTERVGRMYGLNYALARTQPRAGFQDVYTGKTGIRIWYDPNAFPRAWTVHQIVVARNERSGIDLVNNGTFDLRTTAVTIGSRPALDACTDADRVRNINDQTESLQVKVTMACKGLLIVSDNFFPGWRAAVDGKTTDILKINTAIRGVIVPAGAHTVTMSYRPFSVYFGFLCTLAGLAGAIVLQRRQELDGPDLLATSVD